MSHRVFVLGQGLPSLERIPAALVEEGFAVEVLAEAEGFEERLVAAHPRSWSSRARSASPRRRR